ncbi:hypothetical protein [Sediminibacillus massiliensis]|uniref:hypothetical protein n=1 Tax=Sediminibacillus massiliensis TaxID=1926277 RepID=UPI0009888A7B|nr:hypothetical protein [Sediminibacillus massiliensis]
MTDEKKTLYFYMSVGYTGLLFVALAAMRYTSYINDSLGYAMVLFGFLMVISYVRFLEKKLGLTKMEFVVSKAVFVIVFAIISFILYV